MEHDVALTRRDGSVRHFRIHGGQRPQAGDVITLPINGKPTKARIEKVGRVPPPNSESARSLDDCDATEIDVI